MGSAPKPEREQRRVDVSIPHLNLQLASQEEILMSQGVGKSMLHELMEYSPYKATAVRKKSEICGRTRRGASGTIRFRAIKLNTLKTKTF